MHHAAHILKPHALTAAKAHLPMAAKVVRRSFASVSTQASSSPVQAPSKLAELASSEAGVQVDLATKETTDATVQHDAEADVPQPESHEEGQAQEIRLESVQPETRDHWRQSLSV